MLLQDLLALQAVGALRGRASRQSRSTGCGHSVPRGVSPEGRLVLARRTLAVDLVLYHGYAVELGAAPATRGLQTKVSNEPGIKSAHMDPIHIKTAFIIDHES